MYKVLLLNLMLLTGCSTTNYIKVGAAYKIDEITIYKGQDKINDPITARIEVGQKIDSWSYGISHHSQWFRGQPFNSDAEYHKTELFVDYEWEF